MGMKIRSLYFVLILLIVVVLVVVVVEDGVYVQQLMKSDDRWRMEWVGIPLLCRKRWKSQAMVVSSGMMLVSGDEHRVKKV